jgi:hypothetical protein
VEFDSNISERRKKGNMHIRFTQDCSVIPIADVHLVNLVFLNLSVNGKTFPFLFDTGASITVLNAEVAEKISLRFLDQSVKGSGNTGNFIDTKIGVIETLQFGAITILGLEVAVLPSENMTFVIDELGTEMKFYGFLGWDVIRHFKWSINNSDKTIKVETSTPQDCLPNLTHDVQPTISVEFQGDQMFFGFDSGNTESVLGIKMFDRIQPKKQKNDSWTGVDGTTDQTVFDVEEFSFKILDSVILVKHIPMIQKDVYHTKSVESMGLLASDIVAKRNWIIDFPNQHFEIFD